MVGQHIDGMLYCLRSNQMKQFKKFKRMLLESVDIFGNEDVIYVCNALGLKTDDPKFLEQLQMGMNVELEHVDITNGDPILTAKIALAHLKEIPDYYTRLAKMEKKK